MTGEFQPVKEVERSFHMGMKVKMEVGIHVSGGSFLDLFFIEVTFVYNIM